MSRELTGLSGDIDGTVKLLRDATAMLNDATLETRSLHKYSAETRKEKLASLRRIAAHMAGAIARLQSIEDEARAEADAIDVLVQAFGR
jgi:hypothetical protein